MADTQHTQLKDTNHIIESKHIVERELDLREAVYRSVSYLTPPMLVRQRAFSHGETLSNHIVCEY